MRISYTIIIAVLIGIIGLVAYQLAFRTYETAATSRSEQRLSLYHTALTSELERLSHLPTAMAIHPNVVATVSGETSAAGFNRYLAEVAAVAKGSVLYVLNANGDTIASSNHNTPASFVGNNYKFRPYFTQAIVGGNGRFFAIGVTTNVPGYFVSTPIFSENKVVGVAVVKTEFDKLLNDWRNVGESVLVTDKNGIIIISSEEDLAFKATKKLSKEVLAELSQTRKLGSTPPAKLELLTPNDAGEFGGRMNIANQSVLVTSRDVEREKWKVHYLTNLSGVQQPSILIALGSMLLCAVFGIATLFLRSRREETRLRAEAAEAEQMRVLNRKLTEEISIRRDAENQLQETQAELIQSSRLAALGKMSAAIVHEVNQPVSAIRTFTSSGLLLMNKGKLDQAKDIFEEIKQMTERLGTITSDLLVFSRKPVTAREPVDINNCIHSIVRQYQPEFDAGKISLELSLCEGSANVSGSFVRFEQLVSNLLKNAIQSSTTTETKPKIKIGTKKTASQVTLEVIDNGHGVTSEIKDQLFDPFFTTKPVGKGVGLGLALCYAIADEAGGKISCKNLKSGGACFAVKFPLAKEDAKNELKVLADV